MGGCSGALFGRHFNWIWFGLLFDFRLKFVAPFWALHLTCLFSHVTLLRDRQCSFDSRILASSGDVTETETSELRNWYPRNGNVSWLGHRRVIGWSIKIHTMGQTPTQPKNRRYGSAAMTHITILFPSLMQDDWDVLSSGIPETECEERRSRNAPGDGDRTASSPRRNLSRRRQQHSLRTLQSTRRIMHLQRAKRHQHPSPRKSLPIKLSSTPKP
jgi:hypothetical protein